jgi:hypothetical protein
MRMAQVYAGAWEPPVKRRYNGYTCTSPTGASSDPNGVCAPERPTADAGGPESGGN